MIEKYMIRERIAGALDALRRLDVDGAEETLAEVVTLLDNGYVTRDEENAAAFGTEAQLHNMATACLMALEEVNGYDMKECRKALRGLYAQMRDRQGDEDGR